MYYHCVNDVWGYCSGEPELDVEVNYDSEGHCRNDSKTCSKYQTFLQSLRRQADEAKDSLSDWSAHKSVAVLVTTIEKKEKEVD